MNGLDYLTAGLLGLIQGITEFLPVSSSGHLAIVQRWYGLNPSSPELLLFDVTVHLGTLLAIAFFFRGAAFRFVRALPGAPRAITSSPGHARRVLLLAIMATIPTAVIGLALKDRFEKAFDRPAVIGTCLIITGLLLAVLALCHRGRRGWKTFAWWEGVLIGLAQSLAILPGVSRSGATICMASYCGWRRQWAAEFSFLIAVPPIVGGVTLQLREAVTLANDAAGAIPWGPITLGSLIALVTGIAALKLLLHTLHRGRLQYFAAYCLAAGAAVLMLHA